MNILAMLTDNCVNVRGVVVNGCTCFISCDIVFVLTDASNVIDILSVACVEIASC